MVAGKLHHRTCFRCARCTSQLSLANYYETEQGAYCCETCPDEVITITSPPPPVSEESEPSTAATVAVSTSDAIVIEPVALDWQATTEQKSFFDSMVQAQVDVVSASAEGDSQSALPEAEEGEVILDKASVKCEEEEESSDVPTTTTTPPPSPPTATAEIDLQPSVETREEEEEEAELPPVVVIETIPDPPVELKEPVQVQEQDEGEAVALVEEEKREEEEEILNDKKEEGEEEERVVEDLPVIQVAVVVDETPVKMEPPPPEVMVEATPDAVPVVVPKPRLKKNKSKSPSAAAVDPPVTIEYPDELNPFDDEPESTNPPPSTKTVLPAPKISLNPFGSDDEEEEEEDSHSDPDVSCTKIRPGRPPPPVFRTPPSNQSTPSPKKRAAPPPPMPTSPLAAGDGTGSIRRKHNPPPPPPASSSSSPIARPRTLLPVKSPSLPPLTRTGGPPKEHKDMSNLLVKSTGGPNKDTHGQWKRKKGPAPPRPSPQKRQLRKLPLKVIQTELDDIEVKQLELERQGVSLEQSIRSVTEPEGDLPPPESMGVHVEEMILQLFDLVNEKNHLLRRQTELMYLRRQQRLEEEHAELEYQIRCLLEKPNGEKTDEDRLREEELIDRLVTVVHRRAEIVDCLEMDRQRQAEEDLSIQTHLDVFNSRGGAASGGDEHQQPHDTSIQPKSKSKSLKLPIKLKKKSKKNKVVDADKDVDEAEAAAAAAAANTTPSLQRKEKDKSKSKLWFAK